MHVTPELLNNFHSISIKIQMYEEFMFELLKIHRKIEESAFYSRTVIISE